MAHSPDNTPPSVPRPLIYGHRGCRGLRPENSVAGFLHALQWPIDGLELDVVMSADGQVVVSHEPWLNAAICTDPNGQPLATAAGTAFNLYQHDYATIRRCNCGAHRHPAFPEQQPEPASKPLLQEVFAAVVQRCQQLQRALPAFSIELKSTPSGDGVYHPSPDEFVTQVSRVIAATTTVPASLILLMSFDHRVLVAARRLTPYRVCLLIEDHQPIREHIQQLGFVPDVLGPDYALLLPELLAFCAAHHLPIITWTVNDAAAMKQVATMGVLGITTDYPDRATQVFSL